MAKNYKLSDDIAFRFGNKAWPEYPLTVDKFYKLDQQQLAKPLINLFMDYETFGEHQWADTGIFQFLEALPGAWLRGQGPHLYDRISGRRKF